MKIIFKGNIGNVMKYLGINITWNLQEMIKINLDRLKTEINERIKEYQKIKISWFGRVALCKMKIISKLNFIFWMLPIKITEKQLKEWQTMINCYCNGNK